MSASYIVSVCRLTSNFGGLGGTFWPYFRKGFIRTASFSRSFVLDLLGCGFIRDFIRSCVDGKFVHRSSFVHMSPNESESSCISKSFGGFSTIVEFSSDSILNNVKREIRNIST